MSTQQPANSQEPPALTVSAPPPANNEEPPALTVSAPPSANNEEPPALTMSASSDASFIEAHSSSTSSQPPATMVGPFGISPPPQAPYRPRRSSNKLGKTCVITTTPYKNSLLESLATRSKPNKKDTEKIRKPFLMMAD